MFLITRVTLPILLIRLGFLMMHRYLRIEIFLPRLYPILHIYKKQEGYRIAQYYLTPFINENQDSFSLFVFYPWIDTTDRLDIVQHPYRKRKVIQIRVTCRICSPFSAVAAILFPGWHNKYIWMRTTVCYSYCTLYNRTQKTIVGIRSDLFYIGLLAAIFIDLNSVISSGLVSATVFFSSGNNRPISTFLNGRSLPAFQNNGRIILLLPENHSCYTASGDGKPDLASKHYIH